MILNDLENDLEILLVVTNKASNDWIIKNKHGGILQKVILQK